MAQRFDFSDEERDTGGSRGRSVKVTLRAHHPETGEVAGTLQYFKPFRKGSPVTIDDFDAWDHRGAGSALFDEMQRRHPGSSIKHNFTPSTHKPAGTVDPDDPRAFGAPTDWDTHHPTVSGVHRGMGIELHGYEASKIHNPNLSAAEQGEMLAGHVRNSLGMHWTSDERLSKQFARRNIPDPRTHIPVVVHAETPQQKHIETTPKTLRDRGVWSYDNPIGDSEVPVRKRAPVKVTGISWLPETDHPEAGPDGWVHHTFDEPKQHTGSIADYFRRNDEDLAARSLDRGQRHVGGRGKPRHDGGGRGTAPGSGGGDPGQAQQAVPAGQPRGNAPASRTVTYHPAVEKDLRALDKPVQQKIMSTIESLAAGAPGLQTHSLGVAGGALKGWYATKADRGHRIVHQNGPENSLHIGYVGLHDYGKAQRRLLSYFKIAERNERKPLPPLLYHVTTAKDAVLDDRLKTRDELGQQYGHGFGQGKDDTISLTPHRDVAQSLLHSLHEYHDVLNGKIKLTELHEKARNGVGADEPYDFMLNEPEDRPEALRETDEGHRTEHRFHMLGEEPEGWKPLDEGMTNAKGETAHMRWDRPLTDREQIKHRSDVYKKFSWGRQAKGGHMDPLFVGNDPQAFAAKDPSQFALLHVHPEPGTEGVQMNTRSSGTDAGEWRAFSGHGLHVLNHETKEDLPHREAATLDDLEPHQRAVAEAQQDTRNEHPFMQYQFKNGTEATEALQHILKRHGHPQWEDSYATIHDGSRSSSNTGISRETGAPVVSLHPQRADYGTLAHEAAHILNDRDKGRKFGEDWGDTHTHGIGFMNQYASVLNSLSKTTTPGGNYKPGAGDHLLNGFYRSMAPKQGSHPLPTSRVFGPTFGLDHRLFEGEHLKPEVRTAVLARLGPVLEPLLGDRWQTYTKVYLAGSEASEWTSATLEGNGDFDTLIGIDYDHARDVHHPLGGLDDNDITDMVNTALRTSYNASPWLAPFGGSWDLTGYVNANSYDITKIKPYAAYDISDDRWAVKPPHLPDNSIDKLPEGGANLLAEAEGYASIIEAIEQMPEPFRTQQGDALWKHLHGDRGRAFSDHGEGWMDPGNLIEKALVEWGLWDKLVEWHYGKPVTAGARGDLPSKFFVGMSNPHKSSPEDLKRLDEHYAGWTDEAPSEEVDMDNGGDLRYVHAYDLGHEDPAKRRMPIGYIRFHQSVPPHGRPSVAVANMEVHPEYRRQGVASAMQDKLKKSYEGWHIDHGERTEQGSAWAGKYFASKTAVQSGALDLPQEQHDAFETDDRSDQKRNLLALAKDPVPGTHIWRGEVRAGNPLEDVHTNGVGIHWSVHPDDVLHQPVIQEGHRNVLWHAVVDHPGEQNYGRDHPMWQDHHMSWDREAEVRLKHGGNVRMLGAWIKDPDHPDPGGTPVPRFPEYTGPGWKYHPIGAHVPVAHKPMHPGTIDYNDVGIHHEAVLAYFKTAEDEDDYRLMHRPPNEESGTPLHKVEGGDPDSYMRIYRSVPKGVDFFDTNTWATTSPEYAHMHGRHATDPSQDWPVMSAEVKKKHVFTDHNDENEVGYQGPRLESHEIESHNEETGEHEPWEPMDEKEAERGGHFFAGVGLHLPPEDHDFVHDKSQPIHERAHRIFKHLPSNYQHNGGGNWHDGESAHQDAEMDTWDDDYHHGDHDTPVTQVVVHGSQNLPHAHGLSWASEENDPIYHDRDYEHHEFAGNPLNRLEKTSVRDYFGMAA